MTAARDSQLPRRALLAAAAAAVLVAFMASADDFASSVFDVAPGPQAAGTTTAALGPPTGQGFFMGSPDTYSLGVGGSITLGFTNRIQDLAGTDILVCENPFFVITTPGKAFIEAMFVEVSTDGAHFARFPTRYAGPPGPFAPTVGINPPWFKGFAGVLPVSANLGTGVDPLDVVAGGGDAFDLADLQDDPAVLAGDVNLDDIEYVRLVDVPSGAGMDSNGQQVWDCGLDSFACADVDAVVAVNNFGNVTPGRPRVEMTFASGTLTIHIEDDNGFNDVKAGLTASANAVPIDFYSLVPLFTISNHTATGVTLSVGPIPPGAVKVILAVGARDHLHQVGGDSVTFQ